MKRLLLCTDLDRTLLPNGPQPESPGARKRFRRLAARPEVTLVYVTGRDRSLVEQAIHQYQLPQPNYVIADVGSSVYQLNAMGWQYWKAWEDTIDRDWAGKSPAELKRLLAGFTDMQAQEFSKQGRHKLSYSVPLYVDLPKLLEKVRQRLDGEGIRANLIWSIDEPQRIGLLDILPVSAGKREAVEFLMENKHFSQQETLFAGDSGNDLAVLNSPIYSVLVANAAAEVRAEAITLAEQSGLLESLYLAKGGYLGMNGNYSAGILEGLTHFMPECEAWFEGDND